MTPSREAVSDSAEVRAGAEQQLAALIRQAVAEEREACAALADAARFASPACQAPPMVMHVCPGADHRCVVHLRLDTARILAVAIRARGGSA